MRSFFVVVAILMGSQITQASDWDEVPIPASPPAGTQWKLHSVSDDFSYDAPPVEKPAAFTDSWRDSFINSWPGPGLSEFNSGHSYVTNGHLGIHASRKPGTKQIYAGVISSKETFTYPLYVEASAKINGLVMASSIWLLGKDSTQEIDILEAYGSARPDQTWTAQRLHLSHHVFIRKPFQDYQPTDDGTWYSNGTTWRDDFHRVGVFWRDPWHLEYYVDGNLVRTVSGAKMIDPKDFTGGTGLNKPMHLIINTEDQNWRSDGDITPTDEELADTERSIMWVDWVRVYQAKRN